MPAARNTRRSRRLSNRPPADPELETIDEDGRDSIYTEDDAYAEPPPSSPYIAPPTSPSISTPELSPASSPRSEHSDFAPPRTTSSSHARKRKEGHIPRPPNAFILFRSEMWKKDLKDVSSSGPEKDHRQISRIAGLRWKVLDEATKEQYKRKAREVKADHQRMYPGYRYIPTGKRKVKRRKSKQDAARELKRCNLISRLISAGFTQDSLQWALHTIEHDEADEDDIIAGRLTRPVKVSAKLSHRQSVAPSSSRTRRQPPRAPARVPSMAISPPSALGLQLCGSSETYYSELAMPELVQPCSTLNESTPQVGQALPYLLCPHPGSSENLQNPNMQDPSTLGVSLGAVPADYSTQYENSYLAACGLGPVVSPFQQYSSPGTMPSPLHMQPSPLHQLSSPLHQFSSPLPSHQQFSLTSSSYYIDAQVPSPHYAPYNQPTSPLPALSPLSSPEASSSSSSGDSFGNAEDMCDAYYSPPATSPDGLGLLLGSYPPDSYKGNLDISEPNYGEWIRGF